MTTRSSIASDVTKGGVRAQVVTKSSFEPLIKGLTDKTQRGILRPALRRAGQQTVLKEARKNVRKAAGSKHAKAVIVQSKATNKVAFAKIGARKETDWSKIGHLIEFGTKSHLILAGAARRARGRGGFSRTRRPSTKKIMVGRDGTIYGKSVEHPGSRAKPWLAPAWALMKRPAVVKFGEFVVEEMNKAIAKGKR